MAASIRQRQRAECCDRDHMRALTASHRLWHPESDSDAAVTRFCLLGAKPEMFPGLYRKFADASGEGEALRNVSEGEQARLANPRKRGGRGEGRGTVSGDAVDNRRW